MFNRIFPHFKNYLIGSYATPFFAKMVLIRNVKYRRWFNLLSGYVDETELLFKANVLYYFTFVKEVGFVCHGGRLTRDV